MKAPYNFAKLTITAAGACFYVGGVWKEIMWSGSKY